MRHPRRLLASLACCIAACQAAHADRSRIGTDSDVLDAGDCEVETTFQHTTARGSRPERVSSIQLNCGIGWRTELAAAFAKTRTQALRMPAFGIEGKTTLRERGEAQLGWSLAYGVGAERGAGLSWRRNGQFIALEATSQFDSVWFLEAKLGTSRDRESRSDSTVWGLAVERALTEAVELRLELKGDDRRRPHWATVLRYSIWPDRALISLSYGVRTGPIRERQVELGLTFEF